MYFATIDGLVDDENPVNRKAAGTLCECCRLAASLDGEGYPALLARFIYPGDIRDHGMVRLRAGGAAPSVWRVTFDEWKIKGCPEHGPAMSIDGDDRYHIAWFTQGSARQGLFYAYSTDSGQHFSNPMPFGTSENLPSHPDVLALANHVVLAWTEVDRRRTSLLIMQSLDGGRTWQPPQTIAESKGGTDFPFLLSNGGNIFVSWNSKKEGYRLIRIAPARTMPEVK